MCWFQCSWRTCTSWISAWCRSSRFWGQTERTRWCYPNRGSWSFLWHRTQPSCHPRQRFVCQYSGKKRLWKKDIWCISSFDKHLPSAKQWFVSIDALNFGIDFFDGSAGSDILNWWTILGSEWSISAAVVVQGWVDLLNKVWDVTESGVISWVSIDDGN